MSILSTAVPKASLGDAPRAVVALLAPAVLEAKERAAQTVTEPHAREPEFCP